MAAIWYRAVCVAPCEVCSEVCENCGNVCGKCDNWCLQQCQACEKCCKPLCSCVSDICGTVTAAIVAGVAFVFALLFDDYDFSLCGFFSAIANLISMVFAVILLVDSGNGHSDDSKCVDNASIFSGAFIGIAFANALFIAYFVWKMNGDNVATDRSERVTDFCCGDLFMALYILFFGGILTVVILAMRMAASNKSKDNCGVSGNLNGAAIAMLVYCCLATAVSLTHVTAHSCEISTRRQENECFGCGNLLWLVPCFWPCLLLSLCCETLNVCCEKLVDDQNATGAYSSGRSADTAHNADTGMQHEDDGHFSLFRNNSESERAKKYAHSGQHIDSVVAHGGFHGQSSDGGYALAAARGSYPAPVTGKSAAQEHVALVVGGGSAVDKGYDSTGECRVPVSAPMQSAAVWQPMVAAPVSTGASAPQQSAIVPMAKAAFSEELEGIPSTAEVMEANNSDIVVLPHVTAGELVIKGSVSGSLQQPSSDGMAFGIASQQIAEEKEIVAAFDESKQSDDDAFDGDVEPGASAKAQKTGRGSALLQTVASVGTAAAAVGVGAVAAGTGTVVDSSAKVGKKAIGWMAKKMSALDARYSQEPRDGPSDKDLL